MQDPAPSVSANPSADSPAPAAGTAPAAAESEPIALPPLGNDAQPAETPAISPRKEMKESAAIATSVNPVTPSETEPASVPSPEPAAAGIGDELPPLPVDLSATTASPAPVAQPAGAATTPPASEPIAGPAAGGSATPHAEDEILPPLPVGMDASPSIPVTPTTAPAPGTRDVVEPAPVAQGPAPAPAPPAEKIDPQGVAAPGSTSTAAAGTVAETTPVAEPVPAADPSSPTPSVVDVARPAAEPSPTPAPAASTDPAGAAPSSAASTGSPIGDGSPRLSASGPKMSAADANFTIPERPTPPSSLSPEQLRQIEKIARLQEQEEQQKIHAQVRPQGDAPARDTSSSNLQTQTQLDISRAPSPAEARPIKAIPVPEDWVPLAARNWAPQRKFWAAAATCHLPLYFQDPVLERYGHSVEQFVGPVGRYLTYPVDDPRQSTQRNQIIQPFFSVGLFALQIASWPYNLVMDPPWEAQYDLGYYRPGDMIPVDTYWLPLHGYGPPLRGNRY